MVAGVVVLQVILGWLDLDLKDRDVKTRDQESSK